MTDPQTPMLKVVEGPETGNSLSLSGRTRVVIGRRVNTDLQILDPGISGKHCEVCADDAGYIVRDLGSSNGTFLNGRQIEKETLRDSDVIHVGHSAIQYLATGVGLTDSQPIPVDAVLV